MKIKDGCEVSTSDFWYDLTCGGYLKPNKMLESKDEANRVLEAIEVIREFEASCEAQIDNFSC